MNNLSIGVVMFDARMAAVEMNRTMQQWFAGLVPGSRIPCCYDRQCVPGEDACGDCALREVFRTGNTGEVTRTLKVESLDREFRIVTSPIFGEEGEVAAGIGLYEDITDKLLLERDLHRAQKLEAVGQLAAGIAHEINSPIQFISDNIYFLKDSFADIIDIINKYDDVFDELDRSGGVGPENRQRLAGAISNADLAYLLDEIPKTFEQSLDGIRRIEKIVRAMKAFLIPAKRKRNR